jgi:hypothetical protein
MPDRQAVEFAEGVAGLAGERMRLLEEFGRPLVPDAGVGLVGRSGFALRQMQPAEAVQGIRFSASVRDPTTDLERPADVLDGGLVAALQAHEKTAATSNLQSLRRANLRGQGSAANLHKLQSGGSRVRQGYCRATHCGRAPHLDGYHVVTSGIDASKLVAAVLSPDAFASPWVRRELDYAGRTGKPFLPIVFKAPEPPRWFEFEFGRVQRIDARGANGDIVSEILIRAVQHALRVSALKMQLGDG